VAEEHDLLLAEECADEQGQVRAYSYHASNVELVFEALIHLLHYAHLAVLTAHAREVAKGLPEGHLMARYSRYLLHDRANILGSKSRISVSSWSFFTMDCAAKGAIF